MAAEMQGGNFAHGGMPSVQSDLVMPLFSLKGRTAIVSGAGAGIGLSVARGFAEAGANVAIWYNSNKKALDEAAKIEKDFGVKCKPPSVRAGLICPGLSVTPLFPGHTNKKTTIIGKAYSVNVQSWDAVRDAVDQIVKEFNGRLDVFVANSGIAWEDGPFIDGPIDRMQKVLSVNIDGTFYCARAAALHWRRQKQEGTTVDGQKLDNFRHGSFIATASMSGHIANIPQAQTVYNASKAAIIHACK